MRPAALMAHNLQVRDAIKEKMSTGLTQPAVTGETSDAVTGAQSENPRGFRLSWIEGLFLLFLAGLAVLPPVREIHKQLILAAIAVLQVLESQVVVRSPRYGRGFVVLLKILLATLLLDHTGELAINSAYYPIYYLPVVTAATYFGTWGTLFWTGLTSAAYCSLLIPALQEFALTGDVVTELATRILFFFLAAMLVNRFSVEIRRRATAYQ